MVVGQYKVEGIKYVLRLHSGSRRHHVFSVFRIAEPKFKKLEWGTLVIRHMCRRSGQ
jgi:hypothetical protein